jgi:hypothetical protein
VLAPGKRPDDGPWNEIDGTIAAVIYLGAHVKYSIAIRGATLTARVEAADDGATWKPGDDVLLRWRVGDGVLVFDAAEALR